MHDNVVWWAVFFQRKSDSSQHVESDWTIREPSLVRGCISFGHHPRIRTVAPLNGFINQYHVVSIFKPSIIIHSCDCLQPCQSPPFSSSTHRRPQNGPGAASSNSRMAIMPIQAIAAKQKYQATIINQQPTTTSRRKTITTKT